MCETDPSVCLIVIVEPHMCALFSFAAQQSDNLHHSIVHFARSRWKSRAKRNW